MRISIRNRVLAILGFIYFGASQIYPAQKDYQLMLFVDANSLLCSFCLDPLIKFNELIREINAEEITQGILINIKNNSNISKKIYLKQISVALESINLFFPILIESEGEIGMLGKENYLLLISNKDNHIAQWFKLPVDKNGIQLLLKAMEKNDDD